MKGGDINDRKRPIHIRRLRAVRSRDSNLIGSDSRIKQARGSSGRLGQTPPPFQEAQRPSRPCNAFDAGSFSDRFWGGVAIVRSILPPVSVITINKDRDAHCDRLIEALRKSTQPHECIVVEIGSRKTIRCDGDVRYIPLSEDGLPLALARNTGRRHATGEILIFLDVDCIPSVDLVAALADAVAAKDGLVCCEIFYLLEERVEDGRSEADLKKRGVPHPARRFLLTGLELVSNPGLFWSLAFAVTAATFDRLGGFDPAFSGYGAEDTDLAFRAHGMGIPILFSAAGRAYHQRHESYDPPLQHCVDIIQNASLFRKRHGFWPMQDWLDAFARLGLISMHEDKIDLIRLPTTMEIEAARLPPERPF